MVIIFHRFQHVSTFQRYKKGDFNKENKERPGQPKTFKDEEVEVLLDQDPSQTQEELAESLNVD